MARMKGFSPGRSGAKAKSRRAVSAHGPTRISAEDLRGSPDRSSSDKGRSISNYARHLIGDAMQIRRLFFTRSLMLALLGVFLLAVTNLSFGQDTNASLSGTVTDPSGAAIP